MTAPATIDNQASTESAAITDGAAGLTTPRETTAGNSAVASVAMMTVGMLIPGAVAVMLLVC